MEADRGDSLTADRPDQEPVASEDSELVRRLRQGDASAGHLFVQQYYPGVYHYLLYLTGRPELAEDLTQETFLQAWRRLDTFEGRAPLRLWLQRIAHREFLQAVRRPRSVVPLEEVPEFEAPGQSDWAEAMVLREAIGQLPTEQRQVLILHYLQGYNCQEIGQIIRAPVGTVKYWLSLARTHLQRELGEGDLSYLNEVSTPMRRWAWLPLDQMFALEARLTRGGSEERAPGAGREAPGTGAATEENMERREFLRQAAVGAAGLMLPESEKEIVDNRLRQKVTLTFKGTALSDVCEYLRGNTGVHLSAGASVADEKETLFCEQRPLREVMRQLSRPFGYTWLRSGTADQYRYELIQDLRSQLLEEELRNRDRNEALLALEREIQRYRPLLDLSPDEALVRAKTAPPGEKERLERIANNGWGQIQIYFRLTPQQQAALLAGQELTFSQEPKPGEQPLPAELARGVLQSQRDRRIFVRDGQFHLGNPTQNPEGTLLAEVPEARAALTLRLQQSEVGEFALSGLPGVFISKDSPMIGDFYLFDVCPPLATGTSPSTGPDNAVANARLAQDPALQRRCSVAPVVSRQIAVVNGAAQRQTPGGLRPPGTGDASPQKLTSADVLEALHRATGMPIIADFYTRLFPLEAVTITEQSLFDVLNRLSDAMGLRWHKDSGSFRSEGSWIQFRSARFFNERPKEVPNRLLVRWSASRRRHGTLPLDDLVEIAGLTNAQLDGKDMAEGAKEIWGLAEWDLARSENLRPHLSFLGELTAEQRQMALSAAGLPFTRMSLAQQQKFLSFLLMPNAPQLPSQTTLTDCVLRVTYTHPGGFQWKQPGSHWYSPPTVQEPSRDRTLQTARRIDPQATEEQIEPTRLDAAFLYLPGDNSSLQVRFVRGNTDVWTK